MSKSMNVQFDDGTSHTYDDVPDDVTQEQVDARARADYPHKEVGQVAEGEHPMAPEIKPPAPEPTTAEKGMGVAQTAFQLASEHPKTAGVVGDLALAALPQAAESLPIVGKAITGAKYPFRLGQGMLEALNRVGQAGQPMTNAAAAAPKVPMGFAPPPAGPVASAGAMPTQAPAMGAATPATGGPAAAEGATFLQRMASQFGTMARSAAPYARGATGVAAAVTPGNAGQNYGAHFPQTGPARGMEINPATGAPWTAQELQQYSQFNR